VLYTPGLSSTDIWLYVEDDKRAKEGNLLLVLLLESSLSGIKAAV
jgi:hypothetical protein